MVVLLNQISLMILFAAGVSAVFACLGKDTPRERLLFGLWLALGLIAGGLAIAWIMYPFPR